MKHAPSEDSLLEILATICLRLTGSTRKMAGDYVSFYVRKKVFAYFLNNHHGDGIVGLVCKVLPGDNLRLIASKSRKFYMPAYVGPRGWVGLRLDRGSVDWEEVQELVLHSYRLTAPRRLRQPLTSTEPRLSNLSSMRRPAFHEPQNVDITPLSPAVRKRVC